MVEGQHVPKDMPMELNQNTFITKRLLAMPIVPVPMTMALMPAQPVNIGYWTLTACAKPTPP